MLDVAAFLLTFALLAGLARWMVGAVMKRAAVAWSVSVVLAVVLATVAIFAISRSRSFQLFGHMVKPRPAREKIVAITFDDGPTPEYTPAILEELRRENVRATFFLIGGALQEEPEAGRKIAAAGHEIGNHSFNHNRMVFKSEWWIAREIETTDKLIRQTGYAGPILFRSPYAKRFVSLPLYLARHDRLNVFWDVEPESDRATASSTDAIIREVVTKTRPGSIILLHPMYSNGEPARRAIPVIIRQLKARGYQFVTVSELLARR